MWRPVKIDGVWRLRWHKDEVPAEDCLIPGDRFESLAAATTAAHEWNRHLQLARDSQNRENHGSN